MNNKTANEKYSLNIPSTMKQPHANDPMSVFNLNHFFIQKLKSFPNSELKREWILTKYSSSFNADQGLAIAMDLVSAAFGLKGTENVESKFARGSKVEEGRSSKVEEGRSSKVEESRGSKVGESRGSKGEDLTGDVNSKLRIKISQQTEMTEKEKKLADLLFSISTTDLQDMK